MENDIEIGGKRQKVGDKSHIDAIPLNDRAPGNGVSVEGAHVVGEGTDEVQEVELEPVVEEMPKWRILRVPMLSVLWQVPMLSVHNFQFLSIINRIRCKGHALNCCLSSVSPVNSLWNQQLHSLHHVLMASFLGGCLDMLLCNHQYLIGLQSHPSE